MKKQRILAAVALVSSLMIFGGCNDNEVEGRKVLKNGNKTITVINDMKEVLGDEIVVSKIDRYEGMLGFDWFDDEKIMLSKIGTNEINIGSYELLVKKETAILNNSLVLPFNILSPDKKHIFNLKKQPMMLLVKDIEGNIKTEVQVNYGLIFSLAKWVNNEEIIIPHSFGEGFSIININGSKLEVLARNKKEYTKEIFRCIEKVDNKVFYLYEDEGYTFSLKVYDMDTKESKVLVENEKISNFELSSDKKNLIIHKITKGDKEHELILMNLDGTKRETLITTPHSIFSFDLSTDGTKLVYGYRENSNNIDIIEVLDIKTNKKSQIYTGEVGHEQWYDITSDTWNELSWSPSGEKIMLNTMNMNNEEREYFINVITIK